MNPMPADADGLRRAIDVLDGGGTIVYPTDTLYGLGASISRRDAVHRTFSMKKMEPSPQSLIMADHEMALRYVSLPDAFGTFLLNFPAGPFTLLAPVLDSARRSIPDVLVKDGNVGIRFPLHEFSRSIARGIGPITSTSANIHGDRPPKDIKEVRLQGADLYVDGGPCLYGAPSTIISEEGDKLVIVRHGALGEDVIKHYVGDLLG